MSIEKYRSRERTPAECYVNKTEHKQKINPLPKTLHTRIRLFLEQDCRLKYNLDRCICQTSIKRYEFMHFGNLDPIEQGHSTLYMV